MSQTSRTPDEILSDLNRAVTGQADIDVFALVHEIIDDVRSSYRLAAQGTVDPDRFDEVETEVSDYIANHYDEL